MRPALALVPLVATVATLGPARLTGQGTLSLHVGGARSLPGADAVGEAALYGVGGASLSWTGDRSAMLASLYGGLTTDHLTGADFGTASFDGELWTAGGTAVGLAARATGFSIQDPFTYRTSAVRGGPSARWRRGPLTAALRGEFGTGSSLIEAHRADGRVRRAERDLWTRGADLSLSYVRARWATALSAGSWATGGGALRRANLSVTVARRVFAVRADGGAWSTPLGTEWVGGVALLVAVGGRGSVAATTGRAGPDPLTLVEAGGQGGVLVGWDLVRFGEESVDEVAEVRWNGTTASVRFRLDTGPTREARSVEVLGDFNGWSPTALRREGGAWVLEVVVPTGVHHYGFRVDGEWYVPDGQSGNVPDEWGRMNATVVVAPREEGGQP